MPPVLIDKVQRKTIADKFAAVFIPAVHSGEFESIIRFLESLISDLRERIPQKNRISYGLYYVIKTLGAELYDILSISAADPLSFATAIFDAVGDKSNRGSVEGAALQIMACSVVHENRKFTDITRYFEKAAESEIWELREHAAGFFQKVIAKNKQSIRSYLVDLTASSSAQIRRFVSESLRPVADNKWLTKNPQFSLPILRNLFAESAPYPRTSVGNNLSDLSKSHPELIFKVVEELVARENKHSYWIAQRACRNLVRHDTVRVLNILNVDEYKYKNRIYLRDEKNHRNR